MQPEDQSAPEVPGAVTAADHEAGFKNLEVILRSGARVALRLHAPPALEAMNLYRAMLNGEDITAALLQQCCPGEAERLQLDRLDMDSLAQLVGVATALAFGVEKQKKMLAAAGRLANPQPTNGSSINGAPNASNWRARAWAWLRRKAGPSRG